MDTDTPDIIQPKKSSQELNKLDLVKEQSVESGSIKLSVGQPKERFKPYQPSSEPLKIEDS